MSWTIDQLKTQLAHKKEVKGWMIIQENVHRRERYFLFDHGHIATDQDRETYLETITLKLFVHLPDRPGRQGEVTKKLVVFKPLADQISHAIQAGLMTDHEAWDLPKEFSKNLPKLNSADPKIAEDLEGSLEKLTQQIGAAVSKKRNTRFNSAELFLSLHIKELHLSNGLTHRSQQSRVYSEAAYSVSKTDSTGKTISDEYLNTTWSVSLDDLSVERLFDETADRAEHSLDVVKPLSGKYSVLVDSEVLGMLLNGCLYRLSGMNAYQKLPHLNVGDELIAGAKGDLMTLTLDPTLDYGADTVAISDQGVAQKPLELVKGNKVVNIMTDQQSAQYLKMQPTGSRGNLVVAPGNYTKEELIKSAPQVLEILQFSALFPDVNSGTFSSEIRLAKLHDQVRGTVTWIKGGSLSGSFAENFSNAKFSKNRVRRAHFSSDHPHGEGYFGPEYMILNDVSIVS